MARKSRLDECRLAEELPVDICPYGPRRDDRRLGKQLKRPPLPVTYHGGVAVTAVVISTENHLIWSSTTRRDLYGMCAAFQATMKRPD